MKLKRVWDTTEKKIARVPWANWKPCQVWLKVEEEKFYKQDINGLVEITDEEFNVYWPNWEAMDSDDVLGYYDTNEPTELFSPEDWAEATYTFEDYDDTVLKTGKVKDWETPVAPADPTRVGYIFTGWKPKVKAIYKDTTYKAQYKENLCTVTFAVDPEGSGHIYEGDWETDATTATFPVGTEVTVIVWQDTSIQFDEPDEDHVEYFPASDYQFLWAFIGETEITDTPVTLTEDVTITAKFNVPAMRTVTVSATNVYSGNDGYEVAESQDPLRATREPVSIQAPEWSHIEYDYNLTDEQIDAGIHSIDFLLPWLDEPSGTILFTATIVEWFESYVDLNAEAAEETEGLDEIDGNYTIVGDAVLPVYLVREATS